MDRNLVALIVGIWVGFGLLVALVNLPVEEHLPVEGRVPFVELVAYVPIVAAAVAAGAVQNRGTTNGARIGATVAALLGAVELFVLVAGIVSVSLYAGGVGGALVAGSAGVFGLVPLLIDLGVSVVAGTVLGGLTAAVKAFLL